MNPEEARVQLELLIQDWMMPSSNREKAVRMVRVLTDTINRMGAEIQQLKTPKETPQGKQKAP